MRDEKIRIGLVLFPNLTQLDLTGPAEVFGFMPGAEVVYLWKTLDPVSAARGMKIMPSETFDDCQQLDVICVPGGPGQIELMDDEATLQFLRRIAPACRLVTSVCTGSLVLAAAGLLEGYRATSHWSSLDQLALLGAEPVAARVVRDRNRITGAGVTSGIDFALEVVAELFGPVVAQEIQLQMEYDPEPPFQSGSPRSAPPEVVSAVKARNAEFIERRRQATMQAAGALAKSKLAS
ncbi:MULTISPECIES: DJ-1/PfpI family protein [unclassified Rhizobium]|uniref:DJ-1/PfpI family protein n=1 Tax=unclassified Rhizobium TaxID=2613769 RepID=UPI001ADA3068|nr:MULTISPECIES: DJ-1/PfpI family protein [unclassified Rhizobium]MBO9099733.1 DJ-1/PfpI family protein [Rhizobium sp. L58/93]MBO9131736.1 DJ-1/PfpI family protein [Rhizobium sp. B209b/85]MBO9169722.1 DJ-1/PfpI family protein [Rhizobium sp. L245/93]MBO9185680.1 DJ-1/PfpI family protein [Rhizobium sp. E27B/91]QXZ82445.1 DJ-1/PfpI family protein [Rhizobium sp. K1/93]